MDLNYSPAEAAFQTELRAFLTANLPAELSEKVRTGQELRGDDYARWHAILSAKGWLAGTWPKDYGGQDWTPTQAHIFEEETALAHAPRVVPFGVKMLGPVLLKFGNAAQKAEYLPRILDGTDWWCQGYSEPGAGSDLASLKTRADRDGDDYIVNGQKTWTTLGQYANRIFCLVRTSNAGKPQEGISFLLLDLDMDGIEMRPIRLIEGGYEVNEVFFTDVRVPATRLVGAENEGWTIAKYLLGHERTNLALTGLSLAALGRLKALSQQVYRGGRAIGDDPLFSVRLAEVEAELEALRISNLRLLAGGGAPMEEASMLKIRGTKIRQTIDDLARQALGPSAAPWPGHALGSNLHPAPDGGEAVASSYFNNRKLSIYGGSNEIQRNILAKEIFG
ncbi:MAG: acyl-CoA dehydrogenase family protein [Pseudomonadota bacterium]